MTHDAHQATSDAHPRTPLLSWFAILVLVLAWVLLGLGVVLFHYSDAMLPWDFLIAGAATGVLGLGVSARAHVFADVS